MSCRAYKGTEDKFGAKVLAWQYTERVIHELCADYGFGEIRTPALEFTEVFIRSVGETTDIVSKEMFTFNDRGGRSLTLRPELTAGVARAYVEHGMKQLPQPLKLYYIQPCFRAERPQKGRDIEFFQFGVEYFGAKGPLAEAEVISVLDGLLKRLGVRGVTLHINSLGCPECRSQYNAELKKFIGSNIDKLCPDCRERFLKNPLRALDCKVEGCCKIMSDAPLSLDMLEPECLAHFDGVQNALKNYGIEFSIDPRLVRGIDYYTRTVFEFKSPDLGAQCSICGGGRYDGLIESFGGEPTPAVGFGMGMGRLIMILEAQGLIPDAGNRTDVYIGSIGSECSVKAASLCNDLHRLGISAECDTLGRSVKSQMKCADRQNSAYSMIIGADELSSGKAMLRNMGTGEQSECKLSAEAIRELMPDIDSGRCETV